MFWAIKNGQMSIFLYLICDTDRINNGHKLMLGPGGGAPRSSEALYIKLSSDVLIHYLFCDTGRSRIGVGCTGGGAPEAKWFWAINNGQMSIFLYLFVTLAGHKLVLDPGGGAPRS